MLPRNALPQVCKALHRQAATALLGPRQVGKTTLALEITDTTEALYLDLQSSSDRARLIDPRLYLCLSILSVSLKRTRILRIFYGFVVVFQTVIWQPLITTA